MAIKYNNIQWKQINLTKTKQTNIRKTTKQKSSETHRDQDHTHLYSQGSYKYAKLEMQYMLKGFVR